MQRLAVRQLAEFVFRQGDLHPARYARGVEAAEGIACQQKIQERRRQGSSAFESEVSVRADVEIDFTPTRLAGRIDGLFRGAQGVWRIEEYKTTRALEVDLSPIDWAQCLIYAGLLTQQQSLERIELAVIYVHPESLAEQIFERSICATTAQVSLAFALLCYEARRRLHRLRCERRTLWMQTRDFPFERYRSAQRSAARKVYRTLENGEHLLLEAPTGSGKSMATIYPALKFMRSEQQLFFLTNRSTGAEAALKSAGFIADSSNCLSVVQITAKDKMCRSGGVPCEPQDCARCKNYFARAPYAVNHLLGMGVVDRSKLQQVAEEFVVCPYELSLDLAHWADMIIGDYNYLFDPFVKLQRFLDSGQNLLLVDEAHQLSGRVSEMLSAELAVDAKAALLESPSDDFSFAANEVFRQIRGLAETTSTDPMRVIERPLQLEASAQRLIDSVESLKSFDDLDAESLALYFACLRWVRSLEWFQEGRYKHLSIQHPRGFSIQRLCLDSSEYIEGVLNAHAASIRLSATVSPLDLYQRLHGCAGEQAERAASPFNVNQTAVLIVRDIPTYFRQRSSSLPKLSELVNGLVEAQPGRYLIAFSSYSYLEAFAEQHGPVGHLFRSQKSGESTEDLQNHKRAVEREPSVVFGVVMGGSFSESIEFGAGQLSGVIVVGLGLPPPTLQRDLVVEHFNELAGAGWGQLVAYTQPALTKVIQMAGRLVRSEHDRGVICLVDERFLQPQMQGFLPAHWTISNLLLRQVKSKVRAFWRMT